MGGRVGGRAGGRGVVAPCKLGSACKRPGHALLLLTLLCLLRLLCSPSPTPSSLTSCGGPSSWSWSPPATTACTTPATTAASERACLLPQQLLPLPPPPPAVPSGRVLPAVQPATLPQPSAAGIDCSQPDSHTSPAPSHQTLYLQEPRRHPDRLGPHVWNLPGGAQGQEAHLRP